MSSYLITKSYDKEKINSKVNSIPFNEAKLAVFVYLFLHGDCCRDIINKFLA